MIQKLSYLLCYTSLVEASSGGERRTRVYEISRRERERGRGDDKSQQNKYVNYSKQRAMTRVEDPVFEKRSNPDPVFKIWSDPDPVFHEGQIRVRSLLVWRIDDVVTHFQRTLNTFF